MACSTGARRLSTSRRERDVAGGLAAGRDLSPAAASRMARTTSHRRRVTGPSPVAIVRDDLSHSLEPSAVGENHGRDAEPDAERQVALRAQLLGGLRRRRHPPTQGPGEGAAADRERRRRCRSRCAVPIAIAERGAEQSPYLECAAAAAPARQEEGEIVGGAPAPDAPRGPGTRAGPADHAQCPPPRPMRPSSTPTATRPAASISLAPAEARRRLTGLAPAPPTAAGAGAVAAPSTQMQHQADERTERDDRPDRLPAEERPDHAHQRAVAAAHRLLSEDQLGHLPHQQHQTGPEERALDRVAARRPARARRQRRARSPVPAERELVGDDERPGVAHRDAEQQRARPPPARAPRGSARAGPPTPPQRTAVAASTAGYSGEIRVPQPAQRPRRMNQETIGNVLVPADRAAADRDSASGGRITDCFGSAPQRTMQTLRKLPSDRAEQREVADDDDRRQVHSIAHERPHEAGWPRRRPR